jgi:hypothetical protein
LFHKVALVNSLPGFGSPITLAQPNNFGGYAMRQHFAALATAAAVSFFLLPAATANAMPVGGSAGIQDAIADTSMIEQVRRVCRRDPMTGRRVCWTDRSGPITVCHWVRDRRTGRMVQDCY